MGVGRSALAGRYGTASPRRSPPRFPCLAGSPPRCGMLRVQRHGRTPRRQEPRCCTPIRALPTTNQPCRRARRGVARSARPERGGARSGGARGPASPSSKRRISPKSKAPAGPRARGDVLYLSSPRFVPGCGGSIGDRAGGVRVVPGAAGDACASPPCRCSTHSPSNSRGRTGPAAPRPSCAWWRRWSIASRHVLEQVGADLDRLSRETVPCPATAAQHPPRDTRFARHAEQHRPAWRDDRQSARHVAGTGADRRLRAAGGRGMDRPRISNSGWRRCARTSPH